MSIATTPDPRIHLDEQDRDLLHKLRHRSAHRRREPRQPAPAPPSLGNRVADIVAAVVGSWRFVLLQSALLAAWLIGNAAFGTRAWDPYPFILLNLLLSFQAAYTAPIIMMSQNRQAEIDRRNAEHDFRINVKAELEIELLHNKIDALREQEIVKLVGIIQRLSSHLAPGLDLTKDSETGKA
jgi:uncharacterized membrane protein